MKNKRVIALLATASLIVSVPVTSMAGDALGSSLQSDTVESGQNTGDSAVGKSLCDSDEDSAITDTPDFTPDTEISDMPYSAPDTSISDNTSPADTFTLQKNFAEFAEAAPAQSDLLGNDGISPQAEEDFVLSGTTLTSYTGTDEEVIVPEGVTRIGRDAFKNNTTIRRVVLPESCNYIQYAIFTTCTNLEEEDDILPG